MQRYKSTHRMRDLVADNIHLLPALSRFGISPGFGDSTVADVCAARGVDTPTFLAVANFMSDKPYDINNISAIALMAYLKSAHSYFLDYLLPDIRRRLLEALSSAGAPDTALFILKFFDEYSADVRRHMEYENTRVFGYVEGLLQGRPDPGFTIATFRDHHHPIAEKLHEIKELLICHFNVDAAHTDRLNAVLFDIVLCERDQIAHCRLEDELFVPTVQLLEAALPSVEEESDTTADQLDANGDLVLTPRERDIVANIARGLSNKEIASRLFLSVHTVATHRRNICAKLNIHSASGMTVYAILHGLVTIDELE